MPPLATLGLLACSGGEPGGNVRRPDYHGVVRPPELDSGSDTGDSAVPGDSGDGGDSADSGMSPPPPWLRVEELPAEIYADGRSSGRLVVSAFDAQGNPLPDGARLPASINLGRVALNPVQDGVAVGRVTAGTWPGEAQLDFGHFEVEGPSSVSFQRAPALSAQLHIHGSFSEGTGTMQSHATRADALGLDVVWWTDHELAYYPRGYLELPGFDFESGSLDRTLDAAWHAHREVVAQWKTYVETFDEASATASADAARHGDFGLRLTGDRVATRDGTQQAYGVSVVSQPRVQTHQLMAGVHLSFSYRPVATSSDSALFIEIPIGLDADQTTTINHGYRVVFYHPADSTLAEDDGRTAWIPLTGATERWSEVSVNLSEVVDDSFPELALDAHVDLARAEIRTLHRGTVTYDLDDFAFSQDIRGTELLEVQQSYLDGLGTTARHHVGLEWSWLHDEHLTVFGENWSFIPFWDGNDHDVYEGVDQAHGEGSIVALAHMFGTGGDALDEAARRSMVMQTMAELLAAEAYGCDLLEVGYREREGTLDDHLAVWDTLTERGIYLTGTGVSDHHNDSDWAAQPNNLVTWVSSPSDARDDLVWNLRRGAAWLGDPDYFPGAEAEITLSAPDLRADMGQVVVGASGPTPLEFSFSPSSATWSVRLLRDGDVYGEWPAADGSTWEMVIIDAGDPAAYRVEVLDDTGTRILLSNWIAFVDDDDGQSVPGWRLPEP